MDLSDEIDEFLEIGLDDVSDAAQAPNSPEPPESNRRVRADSAGSDTSESWEEFVDMRNRISSSSSLSSGNDFDPVKQASVDTRNWMRHLRQQIGNATLDKIAIPGSHDSATYGIHSRNPLCTIAPDFPVAWLSSVKILQPVFLKISQAQRLDIYQQLEAGIRYFDIRVAPRQVTTADGKEKQQLWIVHGLYSVPLKEVIRQFAVFLHEHDYEIVVIDFQHFYKMTPELHMKIGRKLKKHLGALLIASTVPLTTVPIKQLVADQTRVCVTYGYDWDGHGKHEAMQQFHFLRNSPDHLQSPWANTMSRAQLKQTLQGNLNGRSPHHLHCTQLVLTPQVKTAIAMKSLRDIAVNVNGLVHQWINEWHLADLHPNILMIDHIETCPEFVPAIIKINAERSVKHGWAPSQEASSSSSSSSNAMNP